MATIKKIRFISLAILINISGVVLVRAQDSIPPDFCITADEYRLFKLVNDYRQAMNLPQIQLSKSLSFVAKQHAIDLFTNKPDSNTCNFHSWSNKGKWKACCFEKEIKDKSCMLKKPLELTNYPGVAYEVVYWENKEANADKAFDQWRETSASRAILTNFKEWESFNWVSMGVGIYQGFALAWFGEEADVEKETIICGTNEKISFTITEEPKEQLVVSESTGRFYIIFGIFNSLDEAKAQVKNYSNEGFKKAKVVTKDNKFRISLSDYPSQELAQTAKKELPAKFKEAWILEF